MQSTVNFNGPNEQESDILDNSQRKRGRLWYRRSLKGNKDREHQETSTLPRGWKQTKRICSDSLINYADPERTTLILEKQDNESFGFEIQTYGLQPRSSLSVEMCTFVCSVHEDGAADRAGLTTGSVILTINGISIEGSPHQHVVGLIRTSANVLKVETVCGTIVKRIELDKRMSLLKQTLQEKWAELQALVSQEERLMRGNFTESTLNPSIESRLSLDSLLGRGKMRFSSDSSYRSIMTDDGDQTSVFGDTISSSPVSAPVTASDDDDGCFFSRDFLDYEQSRKMSSRSRSASLAGSSSSSSPSPCWDETRASKLFGTLPRKGRRSSIRQHILKLIPGFHRSVEEEDEEAGPNDHAGTRRALQTS